jgi:hypothetical protein
LLRQNSPGLATPALEEALSRAAKAAQLTEHAEARLVLIIDQLARGPVAQVTSGKERGGGGYDRVGGRRRQSRSAEQWSCQAR